MRSWLVIVLVLGACSDDAGAGPDGPRGAGDGPPGIDAAPAHCDRLVETAATATTVAQPAAALPAPGTPFVIPETFVSVRRISDPADGGGFSTSYTNGYSRWSAANVTGEYVTAFAGQRRHRHLPPVGSHGRDHARGRRAERAPVGLVGRAGHRHDPLYTGTPPPSGASTCSRDSPSSSTTSPSSTRLLGRELERHQRSPALRGHPLRPLVGDALTIAMAATWASVA